MNIQSAAAIPLPIRVAGIAFGMLVIGTYLLLGYWVYRDASARGSPNPRFWGVAVAIVNPVLLSYCYNRWRYLGERRTARTERDRAVETILIAVISALVAAPAISPPDPFSLPLYGLGALLVTFPVSYLLVYRDGWARLRAGV